MQPSEFYKKLRPENFSDSTESTTITLTKEVAFFTLSQLSTDQKEHQFETLGRHLAERFICLNLIPATGPAGGGDGKTDTETYPVAVEISNRWFVPNDRNEHQKRAFAMSVKSKWSSKLLNDIRSIVSTGRGYNRIYFITNQRISDKKKKDTQDKHKKAFGIDIVILDGNRILETVYNKDCLDVFVNDLGLTNSLIESTKVTGNRDYTRQQKLKEIEQNIQDTRRYSLNDYQLGEECINAFIYSRMLELSKEETVGRIERAKTIVTSIGNLSQLIKCHYQASWTYMQYLGDYRLFFEEYKLLKKHIIQSTDIDDIEKWKTLLTLCFPLEHILDFTEYGFDFANELNDLEIHLNQIIEDKTKSTSSLVGEIHLLFLQLQKSLFAGQEINNDIFEHLSELVQKGRTYLSFPMQMVVDMIKIIGELPMNYEALDNLFDEIAEIISERDGEISAAKIYLERGTQKLNSGSDNEAIVWFGKCIARLSKEESEKELIYALALIGSAYKNLGLYWTAHGSLIAALSIASKELIKTGQPHGIELPILKEIIYNELVGLGRIPNLLNYYLLYRGIFSKLDPDTEQVTKFNEFVDELDPLLSCRLIGSNPILENFIYTPDIFSKLDLPMSEETALYILGYTDGLINEGIVKNIEELDDLYSKVSSQPFLGQISYQTNFMNGSMIFYSKVAGLEVKVNINHNEDHLFMVETFLSYLEAFFATSIMEAMPIKDCILIEFIVDNENPKIFSLNKELNNYQLIYNPTKPFNAIANIIIEIIAPILADNFFIKDLGSYLETIMVKEELQHRIALIANHHIFKSNLLGTIKDYSMMQLITDINAKEYPLKRTELLLNKVNFDIPEEEKRISHQNINVISVINNDLWNKALRNGIGFAMLPDNDIPFLIVLFKNIEYGINIFDELINKIEGNIDKNEILRISVIQGIDKNNPYRYKVNIGPTLDEQSLRTKGGFQVSLSRIHTMTPENGKNIDNFLQAYKAVGSYYLIPACFDEQKGIMPIFDRCIQKKDLIVRYKEDIGENDIDVVAIKENLQQNIIGLK